MSTINIISKTKGQLQHTLNQKEWINASDIKISGTLNKEDLGFLCFLSQNFRKLIRLDLSESELDIDATIRQCISLQQIVLPAMKKIPDFFMADCISLLSVEFSIITEEIGNCSFQGCQNLVTLNLPTNLSKINDAAFRGCIKLSNIQLGDKLISLGNGAFQFCQSLKKIKLPSSFVSLGSDVFVGTTSMEEINVEPSNSCFSSKDGILYSLKNGKEDILILYPSANKTKNLLIDSNLRLEANAFFDCFFLESFIVDPDSPLYKSEDGVLYNKQLTALIRVPSNYKSSKFSVPQSVIEIEPNAFRFCRNINAIELPQSVKKLDGAFFGCKELKSINIPNGVKSIISAFQGCEKIYDVVLPDSIENISNAFCGCTSLKKIHLPNSIKHMECAFWGCLNLEEVNIPQNTEEIGPKTFCGCEHLQKLEISNNIKKIGQMAFADCGIDSIELPPVERLSDGLFRDCSKLKKVRINQKTICINAESFLGCTELEHIDIPSSVKRISDGAFVNCKSLKEITIPKFCENIGNGTFTNCSNLESITVEAVQPPLCLNYTFDGVNKDTCILKVPSESLEKYRNTEYWNQFKSIKTID